MNPDVLTPLHHYKLNEFLKNAKREYIRKYGENYNHQLLSEYLERMHYYFMVNRLFEDQ